MSNASGSDTVSADDVAGTDDTANADTTNADDAASAKSVVNVDDAASAKSVVNVDDAASAKSVVNVDDAASAKSVVNVDDAASAKSVVNVDDAASAKSVVNVDDAASAKSLVNVDDAASAKSLVNADDAASADDVSDHEGVASADEVAGVDDMAYADYTADLSGADDMAAALEAVLLLADEPVSAMVLSRVLDAPVEKVEAVCSALAAEYRSHRRGFVLARVAGGYRYQTAPEQDKHVERLVRDGHSSRLSAAALETLAVVAYKQPVSRSQVAEIRGVNVDGVMRTLRRHGYIDEVDRVAGPGQAALFGTTRFFLEQLGLDSIEDLPPLDALFPTADAVHEMENRLRLVPESEEGTTQSTQSSANTEA